MPIDLKRLTSDAQAARKIRVQKAKAKTFASIRLALPRIARLRAAGVRWREIAEALAAQGIQQGTGGTRKPLTASRLTSIVHKLRAADQQRAERVAERSIRSDLSKEIAKPDIPVKFQLSEELALHRREDTTTTDTADVDAEVLRRERLADARAFTTDRKKE